MMAEHIIHPDMSSAELWNALEAVLLEKGSSPEWAAYVMPDLQLAAAGYARSQWVAGHANGAQGYVLPNPQPDGP